jgi:hypothetical protein
LFEVTYLAVKTGKPVSPASPEQWEPGYFDRADRMDYSTTEAINAGEFMYRAPHLDIGWVRHERAFRRVGIGRSATFPMCSRSSRSSMKANAIYRLTGERKRSTPFDMAIKRAGPKTR